MFEVELDPFPNQITSSDFDRCSNFMHQKLFQHQVNRGGTRIIAALPCIPKD